MAGAWLLYCEISSLDPSAPSWRFLQQQWDELTQQVRQGVRREGFVKQPGRDEQTVGMQSEGQVCWGLGGARLSVCGTVGAASSRYSSRYSSAVWPAYQTNSCPK